jgi:hypothetical protein
MMCLFQQYNDIYNLNAYIWMRLYLQVVILFREVVGNGFRIRVHIVI